MVTVQTFYNDDKEEKQFVVYVLPGNEGNAVFVLQKIINHDHAEIIGWGRTVLEYDGILGDEARKMRTDFLGIKKPHAGLYEIDEEWFQVAILRKLENNHRYFGEVLA